MPTYSVSASELKYASSSSWSSGKARQGVYSTTRYEGAINFAGLADFDVSNISISQITMAVTFQKAGRANGKYLTLYKSAKSSISGSISSMRGDSIGSIYVSDAYDRTATLTFNASTNAALFESLRSYFMGGNRILITYVPSTRGTSSGGFCYDYLGITALTMTFTYDYLQSEGSLSASSVQAGSSITMNIISHSDDYTHKVNVMFGSHSMSATLAAGKTSTAFVIPLSWLDVIPSATSGTATMTLETLGADGSSLGTSTHAFSVVAPASVVPTIDGISITPVNGNATIAGWDIFVYGYSCAEIAINNAAGIYGSSIKSYSITTSPSAGSSSVSSFTTKTLTVSGTVNVTATVTDTRGRSASATTTFYVHPYTAPYITSIMAYRCTSDGVKDDVNGTYAYIKASFGCSSLDGRNSVAAEVALSQVGGDYSTSTSLEDGEAVIIGDGNLLPDATYEVIVRANDVLLTYSSFMTHIGSSEYALHIKKGGKAVGIGMAAGDDETITMGWPVKMKNPLAISEGGTGATSAALALFALGALSTSGGTMSGNLNIRTSLYPSVVLMPTNNDTTYRAVLEGSYSGAVSLAAWEDSSGNARRMLEIRNAAYESSLDNAIVLRDVISGSYYAHRLFHSGMATPIPVANGGTGSSNAKSALEKLGIFFSDTLPDSGEDGQICLVPV